MEGNALTFWEKKLEEIKSASFNQVRDRVRIHTEQYKEQGFDDSDTWSLDWHLSQLILPRLKRYKELATGCIVINFPLDEMIDAFELYANKDSIKWDDEDIVIIDKGLKAFAEHFHRLWW